MLISVTTSRYVTLHFVCWLVPLRHALATWTSRRIAELYSPIHNSDSLSDSDQGWISLLQIYIFSSQRKKVWYFIQKESFRTFTLKDFFCLGLVLFVCFSLFQAWHGRVSLNHAWRNHACRRRSKGMDPSASFSLSHSLSLCQWFKEGIMRDVSNCEQLQK